MAVEKIAKLRGGTGTRQLSDGMRNPLMAKFSRMIGTVQTSRSNINRLCVSPFSQIAVALSNTHSLLRNHIRISEEPCSN